MEFTYKYYNKNYVAPVFGLVNTGSICWLNSLLQVLFGLPAFNKVLLDHKDELSNNYLATEYISVITSTMAPIISNHNDASSRILAAINAQAAKNGKQYLGTRQECALEAIEYFISLLGCKSIENLFVSSYEMKIECPTCHNISINRDNGHQIMVPSNVELTAPEHLRQYIIAHKDVFDTYRCNVCNMSILNGARDARLKMLREIIVVVFSKFEQKKVTSFPKELIFRANDGGYLNYMLVGVIEHVGNKNNGHYYAFSYRGGVWYYINDQSVQTVPDVQPTENTFMIVYHMYRPYY